MLGGWFGADSFAGSYRERDLYLQRVWSIDAEGRFQRPLERSLGALVSAADCELLQFFSDVESMNAEGFERQAERGQVQRGLSAAGEEGLSAK